MTELLDLLKDAVAKASEGDRVGIVLSGGLDSSTVSMLADPSLPRFTGYYEEPGFDERDYARLSANTVDHHEILIRPQDFVDHFDGMVAALRPPFMGMGSFGQYMVAKHCSDYVDVVLSGEGSDELFGGYARQMLVAGVPLPKGYEDYQLPDGYPTDLQGALDYDWAKLPDLLAVDDQMCGAWGLEARAPFMDPRVVEYGLALPPTERVGKRHLRDRVRGLVPDAIIDRTDKMGFPIPLVSWAQRDPVRSFVLERIGRLPDPERPWDRSWWHELLEA